MSYTASTSPDGLTLRATSTEGATLSVPTTALYALQDHSACPWASPLAAWPLGAILALAEHTGEAHHQRLATLCGVTAERLRRRLTWAVQDNILVRRESSPCKLKHLRVSGYYLQE